MKSAKAIARLHPEAGSPVTELIKIVCSNNYARIYASVLPGEIGRPDAFNAVPDLIQVLGEDWEIRNIATKRELQFNVEKALIKITGKDYGKNQELWKARWNKMKTQKRDLL